MFSRPPSRSIAFSFASLYLMWTTLPSALLVWLVQSGLWSLPAFGQSVPQSVAQSVTDPSVPSSQQMLEDARQRLIDRGEWSDPDAADPDSELGNPFGALEQEFNVYRLGPGDSIFVNVLRFADLSFQGTLDLEGNLIVPLAGALPLEGLTIEQAREQIRIALDRYVIDPQVDVILLAQRPVQVTILGEVVRPGLYPLQSPELSTALISAGGTTGLADLRTVRIRRSLPTGEFVEQDVDLFTPLQEAVSIPDLQLTDGDIVVVPTLTADDRDEYDRALVARSTLAQPQINVRVLNYAAGQGGVIGNLALPNGSSFVDALSVISPNVDTADIGDIALIRFDVEQGQAIKQELDGKDALMGDTSQNPMLENNDVIVIGRNLIARISYALNTFTQPFRDILGFLLFFDSLADSAESLFAPTGGSRSE